MTPRFDNILVAVTLLAAEAVAMGPTVNVRDFGATGNGITDDQPAIRNAVQQVRANRGGTLYFPVGTYRCGRQAGYQDAIAFERVSNVTIQFDPGAVLLMDNLNPGTGNGSYGHGIVFTGPCRNIQLNNVYVKWKIKAAGRSLGDAFRFLGYPSDGGTIMNVTISNCKAENSPQTGAVLMGVSDVTVTDFKVANTWGDGLHFNACRRVTVRGLTGINTGDDALAFVTYYDPTEIGDGPYNQPGLGAWSNGNSVADNITVTGGYANGARVAGGLNIALSNITVSRKGSGLILDSGRADGASYGWSYLASRGITVSGFSADACDTGLFVWNFNVPMTDDDKWWRFGLTATDDLRLSNAAVDSLHLWNCAGVTLRSVTATNQQVRLVNVRDVQIGALTVSGGRLFISGQPAVLPDLSDLVPSAIGLDQVTLTGGWLEAQRCRNLWVGRLDVTDAPTDAVFLQNIVESRLGVVNVTRPNRDNQNPARGLAFSRCRKVNIDNYTLVHDANVLRSIEIGGGDALGMPGRIRVEHAVYDNAARPGVTDLVLQGGSYGPAQWYLDMAYRHPNLTSWRTYHHDDYPRHAGDAYLDSAVDSADLDALADHWTAGPGASWGQGDVSGDGYVNIVDLNIVEGNWGWSGN